MMTAPMDARKPLAVKLATGPKQINPPDLVDCQYISSASPPAVFPVFEDKLQQE